MTITMNITDSQMKAVLASAETKGISAEELLQSLINQNFPDESKNAEEKNGKNFFMLLTGFLKKGKIYEIYA